MPAVITPAMPSLLPGAPHLVLHVWEDGRASPHLVGAWYESEHAIVVEFSLAVKALSPFDGTDALNLGNWTLSRLDGAEVPRLLDVEVVTTTRLRLRLAGPGARVGEHLVVTVDPGVRSADGTTGLGVPLAVFADGDAPQRRTYTALTRTSGMRDLANPIAGSGSIQVTTSGDLRLADAKETLRKLVVRILSTVAGGFAHLPTWGAAAGLKGMARYAELQRISSTAKRQISTLPGVEEVSVSTSVNPKGILIIEARVRTAKLGLVTAYWSPGEV